MISLLCCSILEEENKIVGVSLCGRGYEYGCGSFKCMGGVDHSKCLCLRVCMG